MDKKENTEEEKVETTEETSMDDTTEEASIDDTTEETSTNTAQELETKDIEEKDLKPGQKIINVKGEKKVVYENVDAEKLDMIMQKLDRLEYAANKGRLMRFDQAHKEKHYLKVKLTKYKNKYVLAWRLKEDIVEQNPLTGHWIQQQTVELFLEGQKKDDKSNVIPLKSMTLLNKTTCEVIKDVTDKVTGTRVLTVRTPEGKELSIDANFIN